MSEEPVRATHPTIFHVVLDRRAAQQFEASAGVRALRIQEWTNKARALGKRSLEVMGPYCRLLQMDVGGER